MSQVHAKDCIYQLDEPEPYYVLGSLVTPQSNYVVVDECGKTVEQIKAEMEAREKAEAEAETEARERAEELAIRETDNELLQVWHKARTKTREEALRRRYSVEGLPKGNDAASTGDTPIQENCRNEWGTNYRMVEYCQDRQIKAAHNLERVHASIQGDAVRTNILANCIDEWPQGRGYNWRMVEYCYKRQSEAYLRLNR